MQNRQFLVDLAVEKLETNGSSFFFGPTKKTLMYIVVMFYSGYPSTTK